jgi:ABC-type hemin transport system ATPase subunit
MNIYQVELPDGRIATRNSKMSFAYSVIVKEVIKGKDMGWYVQSFSSSKELAYKAMASTQSRYFAPRNNGEFTGTEFQVVEVKQVA